MGDSLPGQEPRGEVTGSLRLGPSIGDTSKADEIKDVVKKARGFFFYNFLRISSIISCDFLEP